VSGERVTELLREMPPVDVDHDFRAPLYGDASLDELVGDAVLEVRTAVPFICAHVRHVERGISFDVSICVNRCFA